MAFIGDIDLTGFGPYYGDATSSLADFRRSLDAVRALEARHWVTSHHRGLIRDRAEFIRQLDAFTAVLDTREHRLLSHLADGPQTLDELVRRRLCYPPSADELWIDAAERRAISQHLEELVHRRQVHAGPDGRFALL